MKSVFNGNILTVRTVEDTIRATRKYTEGIFSRGAPHPIQGEDFPSRVLTKHYEVYPDLDLEQSRSFWDAAFLTSDWLWGDLPRVDVAFRYSYTNNKAQIIIHGGDSVIDLLRDGIPGFGAALDSVSPCVSPALVEKPIPEVAPITSPSMVTGAGEQ